MLQKSGSNDLSVRRRYGENGVHKESAHWDHNRYLWWQSLWKAAAWPLRPTLLRWAKRSCSSNNVRLSKSQELTLRRLLRWNRPYKEGECWDLEGIKFAAATVGRVAHWHSQHGLVVAEVTNRYRTEDRNLPLYCSNVVSCDSRGGKSSLTATWPLRGSHTQWAQSD